VNTQFTFNTATDTSGALQSDSLIQGLQSELLGATSYSSGDSTYGTLSQLGITVGSTGTLTLDSTTLTSAISADSSAVTTFFQGTDSNGFAASLMSTLYTYTDSNGGAFTVDLASIKSENTDLQDQINTLETYLASQQTILTTKYNEADAEIQDLPEELKQTNALLNPNEYSSSNS
jgi:flagellar hook-associated protein 2